MVQQTITRSPLIVVALLVLSLALPACRTITAGNGLITGAISTTDRAALPAGSTATVELIRYVGGTADIVARTSFVPSTVQPFPFSLTYDPSIIDVNLSHALRARINSADGTATYMTTADVPYEFDGDPVSLVLTGGGSIGTPSTTRR